MSDCLTLHQLLIAQSDVIKNNRSVANSVVNSSDDNCSYYNRSDLSPSLLQEYFQCVYIS